MRVGYVRVSTAEQNPARQVELMKSLGCLLYTSRCVSETDEAVGDKIMQVGITPVGTGVELSRECLNSDGTLNYTCLLYTSLVG